MRSVGAQHNLGPRSNQARLTPDELRRFARWKAVRSDVAAARELGTTPTTLGKLLGGLPVLAPIVERVRLVLG